tara:strand:+ start:3365 stop:3916 length:552 start_codon:yes stop_codon:yes gene_type:complete
MKVTGKTKTKIERMVRRCMNQLKKKDYPTEIDKEDVDRAARLTRVVNKRFYGATYAGAHVIQINLNYWQHLDGAGVQTEYAAFASNPIYGDRKVTDLDDCLWITVSHEVSHHVQRRIMRSQGIYKKPHGEGFQRIYRWLRADLVNPIIDAKIAEREKQDKLKKIVRLRQMDLPMDGEEFKLAA